MGNTEAQMIHTLTRDREWARSLDQKKRQKVVDRLQAIIDNPSATPREITSACRALAAFDRLDVERGKLQIEHDRSMDGDSEVVDLFRKLLQIRGAPDAGNKDADASREAPDADSPGDA